jgi:hypothetical protein
MNGIKKICILLLVAGLCIGMGRFSLLQTRGFALYKIRADLPFNPEWETTSLSSEEKSLVATALSQPYRFLDKGAQAYVFLSDDGRYVIKFFKLHALQPALWLRSIRLPFFMQKLWVQKLLEKRQTLSKTFASYKIANEELKEETGLLYLHLNKTEGMHPELTIYDNIGIKHTVPLDKMQFLIQRRASLFLPHLEKMIQERGLIPAKKALSNLVHFLRVRNLKEIFDKDPDLLTNFAFLNDRIVQIDVGRFRKEPERKNPNIYYEEIVRITDEFNLWLKNHYPPLSDHLEQEIAGLLR